MTDLGAPKESGPWLALFDATLPRLVILPVDFLPSAAPDVTHRRVGGLPAALVPVADGLALDATGLVRGWPSWMSALERAVGKDALAQLLEHPPLFEPSNGKTLADRILEHQVRAENLVVVDVLPADAVAVAAELRWTFPAGMLELSLPAGRHAAFTLPEGAQVRWNGRDVALAPELAWTDEALVELSVWLMREPPDVAAKRFATAVPDGGRSLPETVPAGAALFAAGTQRARSGASSEAIVLLEAARARVPAGEPLLGGVLHELALTKLKATATRVTGPHAEYSIAPEHRPTWVECVALFEEAARLDPSLPAASEAERLHTMIALLDRQPAEPERARPERRAREKPAADEPLPVSVWLPPAIIAVLLAIFFVYVVYRYLL